MIIRSLSLNDIEKVRHIWTQFYSGDFQFPNFTDMLGAAVAIDSNDQIISAAGIKLIPEVIMITNKNVNARKRWEAINELYKFGLFVCSKTNNHELHAFVKDEKWIQHLKSLGFETCIGEALVKHI